MTANHSDYVTGAEFKRWMDEESAFRGRIEKRMSDGFAEIKTSMGRVEVLQREANGRTSKAEQTIAVMQREIEAIKQEDVEIDRMVTRILNEGCHQYATHRAVLGVLDGAESETDASGDVRPQFRLPSLSRKQKAIAGVGVSALLIPALAELFKLATEFIHFLQTHP
jgi:hypothetical protein